MRTPFQFPISEAAQDFCVAAFWIAAVLVAGIAAVWLGIAAAMSGHSLFG